MNLYVIGDSISIHYGPFLEKQLQGVMGYARKQGAEDNLDNPNGANGGDSSMVLDYLQTLAASGSIDADLLLVNCGLHDIKTHRETGKIQVTIEDYAKNLHAIIDLAASMNLLLIWIRTTPLDEKIHNANGVGFLRYNPDHETYQHTADEIMAEAKIPVIDLHTFTANLGPDLYIDHVHFPELIREKQAAYIAGWLDAYRQTSPSG
jgi:lysophospholipase L1-like esterase